MADWWVANPTGNGFWGSRPPPESVADWGVTTPMASTGRGVATPTGIGALLSFFLEGVVDWGGHDPDGYRFRCCCCCCCCRCRQGRRWRWASGPSSRRGRPRRAAATPATSPGRRGTCACGCGRATFSSRRRRRRRSANTHTHTHKQKNNVTRWHATRRHREAALASLQGSRVRRGFSWLQIRSHSMTRSPFKKKNSGFSTVHGTTVAERLHWRLSKGQREGQGSSRG